MNTGDTTATTSAIITIIDWLSAYAHILGGEAMRAELARHRETLTQPPVAPPAPTPTCWAAFVDFFTTADRSMTPPERERVELLRTEVLAAARHVSGTITLANIARAAALLSLAAIPTASAWGVLQRRVGLLEARSAMVRHVPEIVPVWRALERVDEAGVLAAYEGVAEGRQ